MGNHERMQALIDQLQGKVKSYKKQIEEAEEIAALNLAKYRKVAGALGDAEASADGNEEGPCQVRFPWFVNQPKEDFPDDPSDNWPMSGTRNTLRTTFKFQVSRYQTL